MSIAAATLDGNLHCTDFVACAFPAKDSMKNMSYPWHDGSIIFFNLKVKVLNCLLVSFGTLHLPNGTYLRFENTSTNLSW